MVDHRVLAGSSLISTFRIASGWCSPASPTKVYERSNPWGPSTFISHLSFARDPTIDTRHSPGTALSTCSTPARISLRARESPVFCISIVTGMSPVLYKVTSNYFLSNPVKDIPDGAHSSMFGPSFTNSCWKGVSVATVDLLAGIFFCGTAFARASCEETRGKGKGCDIGYALAISSCEGADSVEARTVTALDAITAFAVPNPDYSSQSRRFFQVRLLIRLSF
jgi:hypothetical protein